MSPSNVSTVECHSKGRRSGTLEITRIGVAFLIPSGFPEDWSRLDSVSDVYRPDHILGRNGKETAKTRTQRAQTALEIPIPKQVTLLSDPKSTKGRNSYPVELPKHMFGSICTTVREICRNSVLLIGFDMRF